MVNWIYLRRSNELGGKVSVCESAPISVINLESRGKKEMFLYLKGNNFCNILHKTTRGEKRHQNKTRLKS